MQEIWVDIQGHPGYQVSNLGRVRSCDRVTTYVRNGRIVTRYKKGAVLRPNDNGNGYLSVQLGRGKRHYIHRLVAEHFLDNPYEHTEVNHKNANKKDNAVSNLEWCDRQGNIDHSVSLGLNPRGERSRHALLDERQVRLIRAMIANGAIQIDVARAFGISAKCVSDIKLRHTWRHVV